MLPPISQPELSYERLRLLLEINNAVVTNLDIPQLIRVISAKLQDCIPHDFTGLVVYDEEIKQLRAHAVETGGVKGIVTEGTPVLMDGTFAGEAFKTRQTILRDKIDLAEFHAPVFREAHKAGLRSGCSVPLISHDRVPGTINVGSLSECAFTQRDAELLEQIAGQVAIAVENSLPRFSGFRPRLCVIE